MTTLDPYYYENKSESLRVDTRFYITVKMIEGHKFAPAKDCREEYIGKIGAMCFAVANEMQKRFVAFDTNYGMGEDSADLEVPLKNIVMVDIWGNKENTGEPEMLELITEVFDKVMEEGNL